MKFLERFTLIVYSFIILLISVVLSLLIFNWIDFDVVMEMLKALVTGDLSSKITLGVSIVFILLSIKCMFFDEKSKERVKETQGILLKNENGQLIRQIRVTINPGRVYSFYALGNKPNFQIFQSLDGATFMI